MAKTVDGVTTDYVLDPAAGLPQVLQETTGGQATTYLYGADLLAQYDSGTWAYHVNDGLGNVRGLADPAGQVVATYSFGPFGVPLGESGGEPYGYTGEQWDAEVELLYLRARYYQPRTGRFITEDPFPGLRGEPQTLNQFVYVTNNPINKVDHEGLYGNDVHFQLMLSLARQKVLKRCPQCLADQFGQQVAFWIADGNRHMDDPPLHAGYHIEFHFKSRDDAWSDVRRMIEVGDPYLVGAALHGLQDYWSHTYEGYRPPSGHVLDSALAGCVWWSGRDSPCQRPPNAEIAILLSLWNHGEIEWPTQESLKAVLRHLGSEIESLTTSNLFDVWLRVQDGPPETRKAVAWKNRYGYDTDAYYPFTARDQQMEEDTRTALEEYFDKLGTIDLCLFDSSYTPPDDDKIIQMLSGGAE